MASAVELTAWITRLRSSLPESAPTTASATPDGPRDIVSSLTRDAFVSAVERLSPEMTFGETWNRAVWDHVSSAVALFARNQGDAAIDRLVLAVEARSILLARREGKRGTLTGPAIPRVNGRTGQVRLGR